MTERIKVPRLGNYVTVYQPKQDIYQGVDTPHYQHGKSYKDWVVNDFTIVQTEKELHLIGITHPKPADYIDGYHYNPETLHEAEYQFYHAVCALPDFFTENSFRDCNKFCYPQERPGEPLEAWAPACVEKDGKYYLIYSPHFMRLAVSEDLIHWDYRGKLFSGAPMMRDPNIFREKDRYLMLYAEDNRVDYRVSENLLEWSEAKVLQVNPFDNGSSESPFLIRKDGIYYLFWCLCDGRNGSYDDRTFVFAAETLEGFAKASPIALLKAHAPELFRYNGEYYIASAEVPARGVSMAKIFWE